MNCTECFYYRELVTDPVPYCIRLTGVEHYDMLAFVGLIMDKEKRTVVVELGKEMQCSNWTSKEEGKIIEKGW